MNIILNALGPTDNPRQEIAQNFGKTAHLEYYKGGSLKGRAICLLLLPIHVLQTANRPITYTAAVATHLIVAVLLFVEAQFVRSSINQSQLREEIKDHLLSARILSANAIISPVGQVAQTIKAAAGVVHPKAYFTESSHNTEDNRYIISCPIDYPSKHPLEALQHFSENITRGAKTFHVRYMGHKGIDAGGLSRDYISRLFAGVSSQLHLQGGVINWEKEHDKPLKHLGNNLQFFLWRLHENTRNIIRREAATPWGEVLHSAYFKGIFALNHSEIRGNFNQIPQKRQLEILATIAEGDELAYATNLQNLINWDGRDALSDEARGHLNFIREAAGVWMIDLPNDFDSNLAASLPEIKQSLLTACVNEASGRIKTLYTMARAMPLEERQWNNLKNLGSELIMHYVQGRFNKEDLKQRIVCSDETFRRAIEQWIDAKSESELRRFLAYITGAPVVSLRPIAFTFSGAAVVAHSCSNEVTIPYGINAEAVIAVLDEYCLESVSGFEVT